MPELDTEEKHLVDSYESGEWKPIKRKRSEVGRYQEIARATFRKDRRVRLTIRYILCNPVITAPIPGLISIHQVDNVAKAVMERGRLDIAEAEGLEQAMDVAWAKLPADYQWLKDWEYG